MADEAFVEGVGEGEVTAIALGELVRTDDGGEVAGLLRAGIEGVDLAGDAGMVFSGVVLADAVLHQAREARRDVHGGIDALVVQLAREHDLALGDVAGKVRDRVCDVVRGHGDHGHHGDGAMAVVDAPAALVDLGQIRIEIAGVAFARRDVAFGGGDLAQGLGIVGHVGQDHQDVPIQIVGQILGRGQGGAGQGEALHRRVIGEVDEHHHVAQHAGAGELVAEELRIRIGHAHRREDDREARLLINQLGLASDLGGEPIVRQTRAREDRQLLAAHQAVQPVDGGDAGLDELARIGACGRVDGRSADRATDVGEHRRATVARLAEPVELASEDLRGECDLDRFVEEAHPGVFQIQIVGAFEHQDQDLVVGAADDLAVAGIARVVLDLHPVAKGDSGGVFDDQQAAAGLDRGAILFDAH